MNVFLLGNGFDLHHKFPTAYIDFLKTIDYLVELEDYSKINTIYDVFSNEELQSSCKNIRLCLEQHEAILKKVTLPKFQIEEFRKKANSNLWFQYLSKILNKDLGWIDFEREIANVIDAFRYFFKNIGERNRTVEDERNIYIVLQFSFFSDVEKEYFDTSSFWDVDEVKTDYRIENPIGSTLFEINKSKIINELHLQLEELQNMLNSYLCCFVESILDIMREEHCMANNNSYPSIIDYIFTFNYTLTVEKISDIHYNDIVHIHGDVDNDIILGINPDKYDDFETVDTTFIKFKKYYQRIIQNSDSSFRFMLNWIKNGVGSNDVRLYVVGHSLDVTDKDIIMELFELSKEITIFYHEKSKVGDYTENLVRMYGKEAYDMIRDRKNIKYLKQAEVKWYSQNTK